MLSVVMLIVVMLIVVMLSVVMMSVVAPNICQYGWSIQSEAPYFWQTSRNVLQDTNAPDYFQ